MIWGQQLCSLDSMIYPYLFHGIVFRISPGTFEMLFSTAPITMLAAYFLSTRPDLQSTIKDTIRGLRRNFRKLHKAQQSCRTLQSEVSLRRLPEGANVVEQMAKLQQPVEERMEWARTFRSPFPPHISKEVYEDFMRLLFSSLYLFSPQGRISGSTAIPRSYFYCDVSIMSIPSLVFFRYWWLETFQRGGVDWAGTFHVHQIQDFGHVWVPACNFVECFIRAFSDLYWHDPAFRFSRSL